MGKATVKRNGYIDMIKFLFAIIVAEFHLRTTKEDKKKRNEWILAKARLLPNAHASKLTMLMGKRTHHICDGVAKSGRIHLIVAKRKKAGTRPVKKQ